MIITIDTRWVRSKKLDGIAQAVLNLVKNILLGDQKNKYQLLFNKAEVKEIIKSYLPPNRHNYKFIQTDIKLISVKEVFALPRFLESINTEVFYSPHYVTWPFSQSYKTILTVHDLIPFILSKNLSKSSLKWRIFYKFSWPTRYLLKKTDYIIADSKATKNDIKKLFKINDAKIKVIYNGVDDSFYLSKLVNSEILDKYNLSSSFILYVGRFDPYKNILGLIKSYHSLNQDIKNKYKLILGGDTKSPYYPQVKNLIQKLNLKENILFTGYISQKDLPAIYKTSSLFVFPSFYEGFGLPVLEAMASGTPVITSNTSSLPEVADYAAFLVDPKNTKEITKAMEEILTNNKLKNELILKGQDQSKKFTWQKSAEKLINIFKVI